MRYRALSTGGSPVRRRVDKAAAAFLLAVMALIGASFWGPIPMAFLWFASMVQHWTGEVSIGIVAGFAGMTWTLMVGLVLMRRLDIMWILVRRAAGYDQREGMIGTIFAVGAVVGGSAFFFWLLIIAGPGSMLFPGNGV